MANCSPVSVRFMAACDADAVIDIERRVFGMDAWKHSHFHRMRQSTKSSGIAAFWQKVMMGYLWYEVHNTHLRITRIAVHPEWQRCLVGRMLVLALQQKLHPEKRNGIVADVPDDNLATQLFLKAMGFRASGVKWGEPDEYTMWYRLGWEQ